MPRVIIISGDEKMFFKDSEYCEVFCRKELSISPVHICPGVMLEGDFLKMLDDVITKGDISQTLLLIYNGHGEKGFWSYSEGRRFSYEAIAYLVKKHKSPILIINNCCYSFSLVDVFVKERVQINRVGVIASAGADEISYVGILCQDIFKSWKAGIPYRIKSFDQWVLGATDNIDEPNSLSKIIFFGLRYWRAKFIFTISRLCNSNFSTIFRSERWGEELDHYFYKPDKFWES